MSISERIADAVMIHRSIDATFKGVEGLPVPNTVYVGGAEYHEIIRDRLASWPDESGVQKICHLTIIRVRLESYLQVAYVEGAE